MELFLHVELFCYYMWNYIIPYIYTMPYTLDLRRARRTRHTTSDDEQGTSHFAKFMQKCVLKWVHSYFTYV